MPKVFDLLYSVMIKFYCSTKEREFKQALNYQIVRDCPLELLLIVWLTIGYQLSTIQLKVTLNMLLQG